MIVEDTLITINSDGVERRIQDLRIADLVFDPISGRSDEVSDILARRVSVQGSSILRPVTLAVNALAPNRPRHAVAFSPSQIVLVSLASAGGSRGRGLITERSLSSIPEAVYLERKEVMFFAVFFDRPRYLDVGGIVARAYTIEDIAHV